MYKVLRAEISIMHISIHRLAFLTDIPVKSLRRKLSGQIEFTKSEIVQVGHLFPGVFMGTLFSTYHESVAV